ncbi:hypothetical protein AB4Y77_18705 [Paenarthrobacter sp. YAF11_1]|uniref:CBU_0592 family membrane protein n=1 Tax=Micrococcaceae TaxID=1268 RepID=UPI002882DCB3|nr:MULTISPECIES: hypothetical protein [unclassified Arthrobacter]
MELLFEVAGWAGAVAMLGGYMAVSMGWLQAGTTFQTVNLFGSCAFIVNGSLHGAWPSVVTNVAWFLISAVALLRMRAKERAERPTQPAQAAQAAQPAHVTQAAQPVQVARVAHFAPECSSLAPDTAAQVIVAAARPVASCA